MNRLVFTLLCFIQGAVSFGQILPDVVVTGSRSKSDLRHLPYTVTVVDSARLNENGQQSVIPTLMEQVPGFFATSSNIIGYGVSTGAAGQMKIRGIGGNTQMLVVIDGQPQYAGLMGHPIADAYLTTMTDHVEVLRGAASTLYGGNAMGGVINIVTRNAMKGKDWNKCLSRTTLNAAGGSFGTAKADITNTLRYKNFSSVAGVSYQRTDGHEKINDFSQVSGFLKLGYDINRNWKITADGDLTHFRFTNIGGADYRMKDYHGRITRGLASLSVNNHYDRFEGSLRGYYDWGHHNINDGYCPTLPTEKAYARLSSLRKPQTALYKHDDYIAGINWYETAHLFKGSSITLGLDWQHFGGSAWNEPIGGGARKYLAKVDGETVSELNMDEVGVYLNARQDVAHWLTLDAGIRYDWHSRTGSEYIPQGGLVFHLTQRDDIRASVSKGFRNPTISEMFMFNANSDLKPERLMNYELSYSHNFGKGHLGVNLFFIDAENIITLVMGQKYQNMSDVRNCGVEISGDWSISEHWGIDGNYSYLHMKNVVEGAPEHKLHVGFSCKYGDFSANASFNEIAGLALYDGTENYSLLNATFAYQVCKPLKLWVRGENLLNQHYATYCFVNRFFNFGKVYSPGINFMAGASLNF